MDLAQFEEDLRAAIEATPKKVAEAPPKPVVKPPVKRAPLTPRPPTPIDTRIKGVIVEMLICDEGTNGPATLYKFPTKTISKDLALREANDSLKPLKKKLYLLVDVYLPGESNSLSEQLWK